MIQEDQLQHKSGGYSEQGRWITGFQGQGFDADTTHYSKRRRCKTI
jgi:hypothetical protein